MNIVRSALGHYEVVGNPTDADVVIGHSFGTSTNESSVNRSLADFILEIVDQRPVVVDRMLANTFPNGDQWIDHIVEGPITNTVGQGVGSWGTLVEAKRFMEQQGLVKPIMIAQAYHIGRVVMQAKRLGMDSVVPANLPNHFDAESEQIWTRSLALWLPRETIGSMVLRAQGKL